MLVQAVEYFYKNQVLIYNLRALLLEQE